MSISPDCNFIFLEDGYGYLAENACIAESCIYTDPHNSIMKIGLVNEDICHLICEKCDIPITKKDNFAKIVHKLKKRFFSDKDAETVIKIEEIAKHRNMAAHKLPRTDEWRRKYQMIAEGTLMAGYVISKNFYSRFVNSDYQFPAFHTPIKPSEMMTESEIPPDDLVLIDECRKEGFTRYAGSATLASCAGLIGPHLGSFLKCIVGTRAREWCFSTGTTLKSENNIYKSTGILPNSLNLFFGALDLKDLDKMY